eukprot:TRINITY_DN6919_c1_g1_i1.p1 TRINITY_DN6919_c1_g1~~TRINITY_DN6919_c1_g1_i1.p1  ORF type:complete len:137 (-),score=15.50 TRINITY_DN6919_c1_g1_i1:122-532(-)
MWQLMQLVVKVILLISMLFLSNVLSQPKIRLEEAICNIKSVHLKSLQIPNTFYNIVSEDILLNEGAGDLTISIPDGKYTTGDLAIQFDVAINAVGGQSYTIDFNAISFKCTISAPGNFTIKWSEASSDIQDLFGYL